MDNPQETLSQAEWGWLAGMIDGDGCISMHVRKKAGAHWGGNGVDLRITINNGDGGIIQKAADLFKRLGANPSISEVEPEPIHNGTRATVYHPNRNVMCLHLHKMVYIAIVLVGIEPHLAGEKKYRSQLMLEFIQRRVLRKGPRSKEGYSNGTSSWYDEGDWALVAKFLNACSKPAPEWLGRILRDYTPSSP